MQTSLAEIRAALKRGTSHLTPKKEKVTYNYRPPVGVQTTKRKHLLSRSQREVVFTMLLREKATRSHICKVLRVDEKKTVGTLERWQELSIVRRLANSTYYEVLKTALPANDV